MKRLHFFLSLLTVAVSLSAVPAKPGLWRTLKLADGSVVEAQLTGDEFMHYWKAVDGTRYIKAEGAYLPVTTAQISELFRQRQQAGAKKRAARLPRKRATAISDYKGQKKGLVILAQFSDVKFGAAHDKSKYNDILNKEGYSSHEGFVGSVYDYFKAQSRGQFELNFDIVGPVTLSHTMEYYGGNTSSGNDRQPAQMTVDACLLAADSVNFADYDWDGDSEVEQVYILYAGYGEADSQMENAVWPHEWSLTSAGKSLTIDGMRIDTYACGNELNANGVIAGIGTFCHEFTHCLGLPDMYDTQYSGNFNMSSWDIMASGSYNGNGYCPAGYTSYERMASGWLSPIELNADLSVSGMKPLSEGGDAYILYNSGHADEYYLLENRQPTGWDAELPGRGMLILHVDYNQTIWANNWVNTFVDYSAYYGAEFKNTHQRLTIFHADNDDDSKYYNTVSNQYLRTTLEGDPYPYKGNNSLSATSVPAASLYNANKAGGYFMEESIVGITQNADGTMAFEFTTNTTGPSLPEGTFFHETFDQCAGSGGNDGVWDGRMTARGILSSDYTGGWSSVSAKGGYKCGFFGGASVQGETVSPAFYIDGETTLTFMAAPWKGDGRSLALSVSNGAVLSDTNFTMADGQWTEFTATLTGKGNVQLAFKPSKRFFLDEVKVVAGAMSGILDISTSAAAPAGGMIYTIDGRNAGTDFGKLGRGLYVRGGKKVVK